jgi:hypothetical protein
MRWLRITVPIAFRQMRIEITNELFDVRELHVKIIKSKRGHESGGSFAISSTLIHLATRLHGHKSRAVCLPLLVILEGAVVVVLSVFLHYLLLNLLKISTKESNFMITQSVVSASACDSLPYIFGRKDPQH